MRYLGGHLGTTVSALVDGQLDPTSAERAWSHVHGCRPCRDRVEREGWVKTQLATMPGDEGPPAQLLGSLYGLGVTPDRAPSPDGTAAWAAVEEIERRGRGRRRTGIAIAGAGSVSVAVLGLASLSGSTLGIGNAPTTAPTSNPTTVIAPVARVHGRLPFDATRRPSASQGLVGPGQADRRPDLRP